jgi:hypothetical protein
MSDAIIIKALRVAATVGALLLLLKDEGERRPG